jgi:hypothetical protein
VLITLASAYSPLDTKLLELKVKRYMKEEVQNYQGCLGIYSDGGKVGALIMVGEKHIKFRDIKIIFDGRRKF